jgi:hypothetical protein
MAVTSSPLPGNPDANADPAVTGVASGGVDPNSTVVVVAGVVVVFTQTESCDTHIQQAHQQLRQLHQTLLGHYGGGCWYRWR